MRLSEMISRPGIYINTVQLVITLINILMGAFYLNIWLQTIDKGLHVINVGGMSLENVPTGGRMPVLTRFILSPDCWHP